VKTHFANAVQPASGTNPSLIEASRLPGLSSVSAAAGSTSDLQLTAGPVSAVEILIEQPGNHASAGPSETGGFPRGPAVGQLGPGLSKAPEKDTCQPAGDLLGQRIEVHAPPGARGIFDGENVAVVSVILQQGWPGSSGR